MDALQKLAVRALSDVLVMSPGRGQAAWLAETIWPEANVTSWFIDSHRAAQAELAAGQAGHHPLIVCEMDLPEQAIDLAVLPVLKTGEAEMNRDLMQQAVARLRIGGTLITAVNSAADHWLQAQMQGLFAKVKCTRTEDGCVYEGVKKVELKKVRSFEAAIEFRVDDRVLTTYSRPSVFSHRSIDTAARIMIREVPITDGQNVLELGCGNGAVALAAAARSSSGNVYAVDCNARSVDCVRRAADRHQLTHVTAILNHDGQLDGVVMPCDIALLNPPYYGEFSIAKHFVNTAIRYVRTGGEIWIITKQADNYHDQDWKGAFFVSSVNVQGYDLICYRKL
ncbi:Ribosomal RNA small subunit methyltransferase C [Neorhodopirellula pilleata]|uniref:Ribosomal RNA small subunit methyltransferase C n=2 Tax=Neorhodopirellula pilleata TaxID=2714738 RepID=A0A5C6A6R2_9BACT|nr:Ribosomal RNA small subunit methyltransferase C [Neorhodopirellula pilleata]